MNQIILFLFIPLCIYGQSLKTVLDRSDYNQIIRILRESIKKNQADARLYCDLAYAEG